MQSFKEILFVTLFQGLAYLAKCEGTRTSTPILRYCELFYRHVAYIPRDNNSAIPVFNAFEYSAPAEFAQGCLKSAPFDKERSLELISQLRLFQYIHPLQTYMTGDLDERFQINAFNLNDTFDVLEKGVNSGDYSEDLLLNIELYKAFAQYKNVNTAFYPYCAMAFTFHHQFPLLAISDNTTSAPKIYLATFVWSTETNSFDLVAGERVTRIDEQEPVEFLEAYARENPDLMFLDQNARWNSLFVHRTPTRGKRLQAFSLGGFAERKTWNEQKFNVTFENGTTEATKWMAKVDPGISDVAKYGGLPFTDEKSFVEGFCTPGTPIAIYDENYELPPYNATLTSITAPPTSLTNEDGRLRAYDIGPENGVFDLDLVVLNSQFLYNYGEKNIAQETLDYFTQFRGKLHAHAPGVKVLLDLTSSTEAQNLHVVPQLVHLFFPQTELDDSFMLNSRRTILLDAIFRDKAEVMQVFNGTVSLYLDPEGTEYPSVEAVLKPVFTRNDTFTQFYKKNMTAFLELDVNDEITYTFLPENVVILTDGICSGVCAAFVRTMEKLGVTTVAVGGMYGDYSMQAAGSQGDRLVSYDELQRTIYNLNMKVKHGADADILNHIPAELVVKGRAGLPMQNRFWVGEDNPEEMLWRPATKHIAYTREMVQDVRELWKEAARAAFLD